MTTARELKCRVDGDGDVAQVERKHRFRNSGLLVIEYVVVALRLLESRWHLHVDTTGNGAFE